MKKLRFNLPLLILLAFCSCDDEPIDITLLENSGGEGGNPTLSCQEAIQTTADASIALSNATSETYFALCNDLAEAIQVQINICGDTGGGLQATLDTLDCDSGSIDDCENATLVVQAAQLALSNANIENYSSLCNSYVVALQSQINACGDSDGSIQGIIDGLDCEGSNDLVLPRQIIETYEDGSTIVRDFFYNGNRLIKDEVTYNYVGEAIETDINEYTYENDLLVRIDNDFTGPTGNNESNYSIFDYNSSNQLISETIYFIENGQIINTQVDTFTHNTDGTITFIEGGEETYLLTFENGNLIIREHINGENDYTYVYDNKNAVVKSIYAREVLGLFSYESGINNLVSAVNTGGAINTDNLNITYTYNSENYPETSITVINQGTSGEETFTTEYFYY